MKLARLRRIASSLFVTEEMLVVSSRQNWSAILFLAGDG